MFRDGERRVIARLLAEPVHVLATGGGAFMDPETRDLIARRGVSVWLRAELDVLFARVSRVDHRPLLKARDPRAVLAELIERRHPIYDRGRCDDRQRRGAAGADDGAVIAASRRPERALQPPNSEPDG